MKTYTVNLVVKINIRASTSKEKDLETHNIKNKIRSFKTSQLKVKNVKNLSKSNLMKIEKQKAEKIKEDPLQMTIFDFLEEL